MFHCFYRIYQLKIRLIIKTFPPINDLNLDVMIFQPTDLNFYTMIFEPKKHLPHDH
jgi:hypothetical protein